MSETPSKPPTWAERLAQRKRANGTPSSSVTSPTGANGAGGGAGLPRSCASFSSQSRQAVPYRRPRQTSRFVTNLPLDAWEWLAAFLTYTDVVQLMSTCAYLRRALGRRDSVWEQQMRYFHGDMLDLRGGSLLLTELAFPDGASAVRQRIRQEQEQQQQQVGQWTETEAERTAYTCDRSPTSINMSFRTPVGGSGLRTPLFPREEQSTAEAELLSDEQGPLPSLPPDGSLARLKEMVGLYRLDARREWHFTDISALDECPDSAGTKVFTVPLTLGAPVTTTTAADTAIQAATAGASAVAGNAATTRAADAGDPQPPMYLTILRPVRATRVLTSGAPSLTVTPHQRPSNPAGSRCPSPLALNPAPGNMTEEEELQYVLALSACEAGQTPPVAFSLPPPAQAVVSGSSISAAGGLGRPWPSTPPMAPSPQLPQGPLPPQHPAADAGADLSVEEILTLVDHIQQNSLATSAVEVDDVTESTDPLFIFALAETLRQARQDRPKRPRPPAAAAASTRQASANAEAVGVVAAADGEDGEDQGGTVGSGDNQTSRAATAVPSDPNTDESAVNDSAFSSAAPPFSAALLPPLASLALSGPRQLSAPPPPSIVRLPPARKLLRRFHGKMLELKASEAQALCVYMGLPGLLADFVVLDGREPGGGGPSHKGRGRGGLRLPPNLPPTRYLLCPDLCRRGAVGLMVADAVRVLVVVGEEARGAERLWEERQDAAVPWGHGYNAQRHYDRGTEW